MTDETPSDGDSSTEETTDTAPIDSVTRLDSVPIDDATRLDILLQLIDPDVDVLTFENTELGVNLHGSVDNLVHDMVHEEGVWSRLDDYGVTIAPTNVVADDWPPDAPDDSTDTPNRTDHRAENVDDDFEEPLNVVRTPQNWAQRDTSDFSVSSTLPDATVIGQFDRAGSSDRLTVLFDPDGMNPNYRVDWEFGGGLERTHGLETRQELRGGISVMTYLINTLRSWENE